MMWLYALLAGFMSTPAITATPQVELRVVGVFRTVDLEGRTVASEREVFLEAVEEDADLSGMIGAVLEVSRIESLPVKTTRHSGLPMMDMAADGPAHNQPIWKIGEESDQEPEQIVMRGRPITLDPSGGLAGPSPGRPSAFAAPRKPEERPRTVILGSSQQAGELAPTDGSDFGDRPVHRTRIGEVRVTELRGAIVVARVVEDGLASQSGMVGALRVTIMSGDRAIGKPVVKAEVKKESRSNKLMMEKLEAERRQLERDLRRRNRKPKPFRRKVMKWDL